MSHALHTEVVIVGGGIVGTSTALFLRRLGVPVVLLERDQCGAKASGVNYGGVRRQGRSRAQMPLTQRAQALWANLPELIGIDGEYVRSGHIKLGFDDQDMQALTHYADSVQDAGLDIEMLGAAEVRRRFPWIAHAAGGSFCPQDGHANPRLVSPAFGRAARKAGADVREGEAVTDIAHDGERFQIETSANLHLSARILVNCAGAWATELAARLGDIVPVTTIHPLMMVTEPLAPIMSISLGIQGGGIYARQVARGNCVIGGGRGVATSADFARPPAGAALQTMMTHATKLFPDLRGAHVIRFWSGMEANTPDHEPILGPSSKVPGLFHGFGFSGAGFQIGPAAGEALAQTIARGHSDISLDAFGIERFQPTPTRPKRADLPLVSTILEHSQ